MLTHTCRFCRSVSSLLELRIIDLQLCRIASVQTAGRARRPAPMHARARARRAYGYARGADGIESKLRACPPAHTGMYVHSNSKQNEDPEAQLPGPIQLYSMATLPHVVHVVGSWKMRDGGATRDPRACC
jgi:hypothetical protein